MQPRGGSEALGSAGGDEVAVGKRGANNEGDEEEHVCLHDFACQAYTTRPSLLMQTLSCKLHTHVAHTYRTSCQRKLLTHVVHAS
eukprot:1160578-Pelagomonas_calceolata.AAC.8